MIDQPIDWTSLTVFCSEQAAKVRADIRLYTRLDLGRYIPLTEAVMPGKAGATHEREEDPHAAGTRYVFSTSSNSAYGETALSIPQTEVLSFVSDAIIENLTRTARTATWIPPTVQFRTRPL